MSWSRRFRVRENLRGSLWIVPLLGAIVGALLGIATAEVDRTTDVPAYWSYSSSTATSVLSAIVGATAALTGFVVTSPCSQYRWRRARSRLGTCVSGIASVGDVQGLGGPSTPTELEPTRD